MDCVALSQAECKHFPAAVQATEVACQNQQQRLGDKKKYTHVHPPDFPY